MGMSWAISYKNIPQGISRALMSLSDSPIVVLLIINLFLLIMGTFMDITPAVLIFTPIFLPVAIKLGVDPVHHQWEVSCSWGVELPVRAFLKS